MLSVTYYAQNYAGIIGWSLIITKQRKQKSYIINHTVIMYSYVELVQCCHFVHN